MQWIKDKVGGGASGNGAPDQNFIVRSDKSMGSSSNRSASSPATPMAPSGSFKNPASAEKSLQNYNPQQQAPNPYVQHSKSMKEDSSKPFYPPIYHDSKQTAAVSKDGGSESEEVEIITGTQVLVTIPGAIVHLIDNDESVHLATGDFSLLRLLQEKTKVVVIAKVGDDLKWPLVEQEPTVKLDPTHYYFSLKVPREMVEGQKGSTRGHGEQFQTLNYGVTFPAISADEQAAKIRELDFYLERYSTFAAPTIVQGQSKDPEKLPPPQDPSFPDKVVPAETVSSDEKMVTEQTSAAFWTTVAPNVNDYNSSMAKGIASGAGHIIRGIFWLSDSAVVQLDSGHLLLKSKFKPKNEPSKISPITMASIRSARRMSQMTDGVAKGVLSGILYATGLVSSAVINSPPGKAFFKILPGEVALVSLDAFGTIFDAIEKAGTDVLSRSSSVTQDFVNYRYGESAKELTDESLKTAGHVASTAWTLTKLRKALNPKSLKGKYSKTDILKSAAKQAVAVNKKA